MTERHPLDDIDLKILAELQRDGRIRNNELAEQGRHLGASVPAAGSRAARARLCQRHQGHARRNAAWLRSHFLCPDPVAEPGPGPAAGVRKIDRRGAARPAVLADFRRRRLSAQMRGAKRRGHAPATSAVFRDARSAQHQDLPGTWRRQGRAAADTERSVSIRARRSSRRPQLQSQCPGMRLQALVGPGLDALEGEIVGVGDRRRAESLGSITW